MSTRPNALVLGTAAGAFLAAAGLIPLATAASARADGDDISPEADTDFMSGPLQDFGLFTDQSFADPDVTSVADPSDGVGFGTTGVGVAGETISTFIDPSDPALDSMLSFTLPFTDPLAQLFTALLPLGF